MSNDDSQTFLRPGASGLYKAHGGRGNRGHMVMNAEKSLQLIEQSRLIISGQQATGEFVQEIIEAYLNDEELEPLVWEGLRYACRDPSCAHIISSNKVAFAKLLEIAGFNSPRPLSIPEAAKALLNVIYLEEKRDELLEDHLAYFEQSLEAFSGIGVNNGFEDLFPRSRFLFLGTMKSSLAKLAAEKVYTFAHIIMLVNELAASFDTNFSCLTELLRSLFNITNAFDASPTDQNMKIQTDLFTMVSHLMEHPWNSTEGVAAKSDALIILLNLNNELLKDTNSILGEATLLSFLKQLLEFSAGTDEQMHLHAALLAIAKLATLNKPLRKTLRKTILPSNFDRSMKPEQGGSLKAQLVRLMGSSNNNFIAAAGKLLLTLCKDNVYRLVYHIGYGNAAGFLFNFGILAQYQADLQAYQQLSPDASSDEEAIVRDNLAGVNPITGAEHVGAPAGSDMTEEEKEAEAKRLTDLFERLEKTGVMKVIPDPNQQQH